MMIFKFVDEIYENCAFIVSDDVVSAAKIMKQNTFIQFKLENIADTDDFPAALEKTNGQEGIWINNILPF